MFSIHRELLATLVVVGAIGTTSCARAQMGGAPAPSTSARLVCSLGDTGLTSLSYGGQSLLGKVEGGHVRCFGNPTFVRGDGSTYAPNAYLPTSTSFDTTTQTLSLTYPWGKVSCAYRLNQPVNRITFTIGVKNTTSDTLKGISVLATELGFAEIPNGNTMEAGMWGNGGGMHQLCLYPEVSNPAFQVPLVHVDYGQGSIAFCSDDPTRSTIVSVPFTDDPSTKTQYPFVVTFPDTIAAGQSASAVVSLRFGAEGQSATALAGDVLQAYRAKYPFQLHWNDHRSVGALFLASSGVTASSNPCRWMINWNNGDTGPLTITSDAGKAAFRKALLAYADGAIAVLKKYNSQGMITWDVEGQQYMQSVYYGAPPLVPTLAPEMEWCPTPKDLPTIDAYFKKFRDAGLRVGVCLRPQVIAFQNGVPIQNDADNEHAAQVLKDKLAYAKKRWGCTLFYVDSTVDKTGSLSPDVFKSVADAFPDVLMFPENESQRYYAYTAPLNSFFHHGVTSTPPGARELYPEAFSILMAEEGEGDGKHRDELVQAVHRGDILLYNAWFDNDGAAKVKRLYDDAAKLKP